MERLRSITTTVIELAGAALIVRGVWELSRPVAIIVAGIILVAAGSAAA